MKFLTILIILFFYRNWHGENPVRARVSFDSLNAWARSSSLPTNWRYLIAVGVPGLALLLIAGSIEDVLQGLLWLVLSLVVLIFCLDLTDVEEDFQVQCARLDAVQESTACHLQAMAGLAAEIPEEQDDSVVGFAKFAQAHIREMRYLCDRALFGWLGVAALVTILNG